MGVMMGQLTRNAKLSPPGMWGTLDIIRILPLGWSAARWGSSGSLGLVVSSVATMCSPALTMYGRLGKAKPARGLLFCREAGRRELASRPRKYIFLSS